VITKFRVSEQDAAGEFGMACQRLVPWTPMDPAPPFGVMACFLPSSASSDPDCHNQDEVMIVLSGEGDIDIDGELEAIRTNDFVVIPRNRTHVVHNTGSGRLTWVSCYWPLRETPVDEAPAGAR
jgi:mannose-6-phosphate isomerase-like protein (cupin superfamily)